MRAKVKVEKVAILYLFTGIGHYREALAIQKSIPSAIILDPIKILHASNTFLPQLFYYLMTLTIESSKLFLWLLPKLIKPLDTQGAFITTILAKSLLFQHKISQFIGKCCSKALSLDSYSVIISTHPIATGLALGCKKQTGSTFTLFNVCPDEVGFFAAHFYVLPDCITISPSPTTSTMLIKAGLKKSSILTFGHPLDPKILSNKEKIYKRVQKSLGKNELNLGLYIGGFGPKSQKDALIKLITELIPQIKTDKVALYVLTGGHKDYETQLNNLLAKNNISSKVKVFYTKSKDELVSIGHDLLLNTINIMFSRPSELTFYSLATGIPHVVFSPFGPQELDMLCNLNKYAAIREFTQIEGEVYAYLSNTSELKNISTGLYTSNYLFKAYDLSTLMHFAPQLNT